VKLSFFDAFLERDLIKRAMKGQLSKEELAFRLVPQFTLEIIRRYLRIEVEGLENLPKEGPYIVVSNHSGYSGFDAIMLANEIYLSQRRKARLIAHKLWFLGKPVQMVSEKMGLVAADTNEILATLRNGEPIIIFPEGEAGNFKTIDRRYRLQEFKRGFARIAMISGAPIIPAIVIGAEETHINLSQIKFTKYLLGTVIPIPLNIIPLPVKWKIKFMPPVELRSRPVEAMDRQKVFHITRKIRHQLQRELIKELRKRQAGLSGKAPSVDPDADLP
jgi:1-acyl-sn-glycerol-3-phosphate acyltransferase